MKHKKEGINISLVIIENMGGRDQSQVKIKFKKFEKVKSVPKNIPKCHNDNNVRLYMDITLWTVTQWIA